ncbi:MAG: acetyl-CoA acetyltransferase [Pseudomonadales bacterium]|nr:acetyl-CoA acetyltransferase [Pseudomonadales bacterium]
MSDENIPIIVGTGQLVDREATIDRHIEPLEMLTRVARDAADDAGGGNTLLEKLDTVALVGIAGWHPQNPPNLVAEALGAHPAHEYTTGIGGQIGVTLLNHVASEIVEGRSQLALVAGCNNLRVLMKAIAAGRQLDWQRGGKGEPELLGGDEAGSNELEGAYGLEQPPQIYPLFENALRAKLGLDMESHRKRLGELFTRFTSVAANNPNAWFPVERSAAELTTVTPGNRMIAFPYPKYLNAVLNTEQAAGLIVCSVARAKALGIPEDKWVYWLGGAHSQEQAWWTSERPDFTQRPSMKDTHVSALRNARTDLDQIDHFDFYSCFPVAVEMACEMLGLDIEDPRGFTVTGGLPYAGGPASAYTLHSLAEMSKKLAGRTGERGLVTGNGWYLTKHSAAVLSSEPGDDGYPQEGLIDNLPSNEMETAPRPVDADAVGQGTVEAYTVLYDREGKPDRGIVLGRTAEGSRFLANTPDEVAFLEAFAAKEQVGTTGTLNKMDERIVFDPD